MSLVWGPAKLAETWEDAGRFRWALSVTEWGIVRTDPHQRRCQVRCKDRACRSWREEAIAESRAAPTAGSHDSQP